MRRIILIIFASIMFASIGFAEITKIDKGKVKGYGWDISIYTVCVDGYKFVFTNGGGPAQFYEERNGKSLPAKC